MPASKFGEGVIPIFYFLLEKHDKKSFKDCLSKFFEDVRYLRDHTPSQHKKKAAPHQIITDMSLVIFQPCIGMNRRINSVNLDIPTNQTKMDRQMNGWTNAVEKLQSTQLKRNLLMNRYLSKNFYNYNSLITPSRALGITDDVILSHRSIS